MTESSSLRTTVPDDGSVVRADDGSVVRMDDGAVVRTNDGALNIIVTADNSKIANNNYVQQIK